MRARFLIAATGAMLLGTPALAQREHGHAMPDTGRPEAAPPAMPMPAGHDHAMPAAEPAHDHAAIPATAARTDAPPADDTPGTAPPPPIPADHAADQIFAPGRMARARAELHAESEWRGGALMIDQLEYRAGKHADGYAWKASAWWGGDIDRAVLTTEGEGRFGAAAERFEVQALWRHAIDPWFNMEAGVRQDFRPRPRRSYAVLGIEGLAPYWIEVEAQLLLSHKGDVHMRLGASHDMRIAGPLVLQPGVEADLAMQKVPALGIDAGLERIEAGARLRYEVRPEFAPYVGINWERRYGRLNEDRGASLDFVAGLRAFF